MPTSPSGPPPPGSWRIRSWEIFRALGHEAERWSPSGDAHLLVGPHRVKVFPRSWGLTVEVHSAAIEPRILQGPLHSPFVHLSRAGHYIMRVTRLNVLSAKEVLDWLAEQPAVARTPRSPRASRARRSLGLGRRFGVEIEFFGISHATATEALAVAGIDVHLHGGWRLKYDSSVSGSGLELVSPPLSGEEGLEQVRTAMRALRGARARVNNTCGLHIHHEIRDLKARGIGRLVKSWTANQDLIDWLVQPSRRGTNSYCRHWNPVEVEQLSAVCARGDHNFYPRVSRGRAINVLSYPRYGTVEVRQHGGTLDFQKFEAWLRLGQAIIDAVAAAPDAELSPPAGGLRGLLDGIGLEDNSRAFLLGRAVAFGAPAEALGIGDPVEVAAA